MLKTNFKNLLCHSPKEAVTFLFKVIKKGKYVVNKWFLIGFASKKELSLSCSHNFIESGIFFGGGWGREECKSVEDWSDHQVKGMDRDERFSPSVLS